MKILLINDRGQTVAQVNDVEKYDGSLAGHTAGLLDLLEALLVRAKASSGPDKPLAATLPAGERSYVSPE